MGQKFNFGFSDRLKAEIGGVKQRQLHFDVDAILKAYESIKPLAERLGVKPPVPQLAGFCYPHIVSLGAKIVFPDDAEPRPFPIINKPEEIDRLTEPEDYLAAPLIQERLRVCSELKKRCPESPNSIGHLLEGPITTAVLIMGPDFFLLPYDDPERAHKLLQFSVKSSLNYAKAITEYFGEPIQPGPKGMPDDFAGIFPPNLFQEFVVPYWEQIYQGLQATERHLHSELLRVEHMPFLKQLKIDFFDPGADQYLTPEDLNKHCPCKFSLRIQPWHIRDLSAKELQAMYKEIAKYEPCSIDFYMDRLEDEPKIRALLEIANQMESAV